MTEDKKPLAPEVRALIDDISHRFRGALAWLGQEKQLPENPNPSEARETKPGNPAK